MLVVDRRVEVVTPLKVVKEINRKTVANVTEKLQQCIARGQKHLVLDIDSPGGECYSAIAIIELIRTCAEVKVITVVSGFAASAAALIFAAGAKGHRYMNPNARLLLHSVQVTAGTMNMAEFEEEYQETRALNDVLCAMASENAGSASSIKDIIESSNVDRYITALECQRAGICDHLYVPTVELATTFTIVPPRQAALPSPIAETPVPVRVRGKKKRSGVPAARGQVVKSQRRR